MLYQLSKRSELLHPTIPVNNNNKTTQTMLNHILAHNLYIIQYIFLQDLLQTKMTNYRGKNQHFKAKLYSKTQQKSRRNTKAYNLLFNTKEHITWYYILNGFCFNQNKTGNNYSCMIASLFPHIELKFCFLPNMLVGCSTQS